MIQKDKKKYMAAALAVLFLVFLGFWCIQVQQQQKLEMQNVQMVYQMLGELSKGESELLIAADMLKGQENPEALETGLKLLTEYGYGQGESVLYQTRMRSYKVRLAIVYIILYTIVCSFLFLMRYLIRKNQKAGLYNLQKIMEQFYNGEYGITEAEDTEGEWPQIYHRLESLGQKLKLHEERLMTEKEETKTLVTDLSHQLKTPVASVKMCAQLLQDADLEPEERAEFLERLEEQVHHLEGLVAALVNISRMETGMITIQKEPALVFETVVQAVNQVYLKAEKKRIAIEFTDSSDDDLQKLILPHDVKWTKEAIVNVLENAVKYSPPDTRIQLTLLRQIHFFRIEIRDEGIGIPKKEVNRIFQRFYRGEHELVKKSEGSGVGLYLTRKILEEQGGNISVAYPPGVENGTGTTFVIMLCLA